MNEQTQAEGADDSALQDIVEKLFVEQINPALESHGGFARLDRVEDAVAYVELGGGCRGCPGARMTMKNGVEMAIREVAPAIKGVIDITDHGG